MSDIVWRPNDEYRSRANVSSFMKAHGFDDFEKLLARSAEDPEWFWGAVEKHLGFEWFKPYDKVLDDSAGIAWSKWFVGGETNIALNCVDRHARGPHAEKVAIIWEGEDGEVRKITYADLAARVSRLGAALKEYGVGRGDAVGVYMPMVPETAVALLAIAKIGGLFIPLFSGFGADACEKRLKDADAKVLITADGFLRRGAKVAMKPTADEIAERVPTLKKIIVFERFAPGELDVPMTPGRDVSWAHATKGRPSDLLTEHMGSEDPWMVIYTSGTTGTPKGSVHVHGGFLVKIAQEVAHQTDLHDDDILFWFTDMGWIMGPWEVVGGLALGGTIFFYEGSPDYPGPDRLWDMVARHGISIVGVSPTMIRALMKAGNEPPRKHDLSSVRIIASTGEPWNPEPYMWTFNEIGGGRCPIINLSGGTEVGACFLSPTPLTPLKPISLGHPALGVAVAVVDEKGEPVPRGTVGELAALKPWPGMTRGLWKNPERYMEAYWSRWPGKWYHGDFASVDADGHWFLHGRSDDTIKIAGKRVGPAEVESILVDSGLVTEAAAIGVPDALKGEVVHAYVILRPNVADSPETLAKLTLAVEVALGKPFRPKGIHVVADLPRTRNGKILRRGVKSRALGRDAGDLSSLANPDALDAISKLADAA